MAIPAVLSAIQGIAGGAATLGSASGGQRETNPELLQTGLPTKILGAAGNPAFFFINRAKARREHARQERRDAPFRKEALSQAQLTTLLGQQRFAEEADRIQRDRDFRRALSRPSQTQTLSGPRL